MVESRVFASSIGRGTDTVISLDQEEIRLPDTNSVKLTHVVNVIPPRRKDSTVHIPCHECRTSCQSACKTSCTVGNQPCAR